MKLLFIQLPNFFIDNGKLSFKKLYPLGISYLAGYLKSKDSEISIDFFDFNVNEQISIQESTHKLVREVLSGEEYDFICFSLRQIDGFFFPKMLSKEDLYVVFKEVSSLVDTVKQTTNSKLVIGGPGFSTYEEELTNLLDLDYGVVGEGEVVLHKLISSGESNLNIKEQENVRILSSPDCVELESFQPYFFNLSDYQDIPIGIQTHRGCPFNCLYCNYKYIEGKNIRFFPIENIISQLKHLKKNEINEIYFVDSVLNINNKYLNNLLTKIISENLNIKWQAYLDVRISEETIPLLKKSGCDKISFSPDSGSDIILKELKKGITSKEIIRVANLLKDVSSPTICYNFLFNSPSESISTLKETLNIIKELKKIHQGKIFFWFSPLMILPNSDLRSLYGDNYPKWASSSVSKIIKLTFERLLKISPNPLKSTESARAFFKGFVPILEEEIQGKELIR